MEWVDKQVDIRELKPAEYNPRKISRHDFQQLKESLRHYGQAHPIVVNLDNTIIGGHQTVRAAKSLKWKKINASYPEKQLSKAEEKAFNLLLNRNSGGWDNPRLAELFTQLYKEPDYSKLIHGFSDQELEEFIKDFQQQEIIEDEPPEPPQEPKSKRGEIYQLGRHRVMCGDSTKSDDFRFLMQNQKADMVFTDPPYGVSYGDKNKFLNEIDNGNHIQSEIKFDHMSENETCQLWFNVFENIRDNLAPVNSYYITGPQIQGMMMMMMMMMKAKLPYRHVIIWVKNNHVLGRCDYNYKHEPIFFGWTTKHEFYGLGEFQTSVWEVDKPLKSELHPTMKPVELIVNAILNSSKKDQIVLDPFLGSGSTLIACEQTQRTCYGMEIDPRYVDVIIARWENLTGEKAEKTK